MWKKYKWSAIGAVVAVIAVAATGYHLNSQAATIQHLTTEVEILKSENAVIKTEAERTEELATGLRNLFPQYVRESESILQELGTVIPAFQYNTSEQKQMMDKIKEWIQNNRIKEEAGLSFLDHNRVILSRQRLSPTNRQRIHRHVSI